MSLDRKSAGEPDIAAIASAFADPRRARVLMALARLAPRTPITSLRAHTRAHAVRTARTCYRHLAGQAGVELFRRFVGAGWMTGGDGRHHPGETGDLLSSPGKGDQYRLTDEGAGALAAWGISPGLLSTARPLRYCIDWTEQAHHLAGPLGTAITDRLFDLGWIVRNRIPRSVDLTSEGEAGLAALVRSH